MRESSIREIGNCSVRNQDRLLRALHPISRQTANILFNPAPTGPRVTHFYARDVTLVRRIPFSGP
jgi:hypothetical protein